MDIQRIIDVANMAYDPDRTVQSAYDCMVAGTDGDDVGDTLALFIVRELADCHDEKLNRWDALQQAGNCIASARKQLERVEDALFFTV